MIFDIRKVDVEMSQKTYWIFHIYIVYMIDVYI